MNLFIETAEFLASTESLLSIETPQIKRLRVRVLLTWFKHLLNVRHIFKAFTKSYSQTFGRLFNK